MERTKQITNVLLNETRKELNKIESFIVDTVEPTEYEHGWWQVEHVINEIIDIAESTLLEKEILREDEKLENILARWDENVRDEIFKILIQPILHRYSNDDRYIVKVDSFFEQIHIYLNEEYQEEA